MDAVVSKVSKDKAEENVVNFRFFQYSTDTLGAIARNITRDQE